MMKPWLLLAVLSLISLSLCFLQHMALSDLGSPSENWNLDYHFWRVTTNSCRLPRINRTVLEVERFLVYAPDPGLSNQLASLRNAVAWAVSLNRTLVLPHLLPEATPQQRLPFDAVFDVSASLTPLRVLGMDDFLRLHLKPSVAIELKPSARPCVQGLAYLTSLGTSWSELPIHRTEMNSFRPSTIHYHFGGCDRHVVLVFCSLADSFDLKPLGATPAGIAAGMALGTVDPHLNYQQRGIRWPVDGHTWLDRRAMPALLTPSPPLAILADSIAQRLRSRSGDANGTMLGCVHVRRDASRMCEGYLLEVRSASARPWVLSHLSRGWSCVQTLGELGLNLRELRAEHAARHSSRLALYASTDDTTVAHDVALRAFNLSTIRGMDASELSRASLPLRLRSIPPEVLYTLLDVLVCSKATVLLLNGFSGFSQLVVSLVGLRDPMLIGWDQDMHLSTSIQEKLHIQLNFLRRTNPFDATQLL